MMVTYDDDIWMQKYSFKNKQNTRDGKKNVNILREPKVLQQLKDDVTQRRKSQQKQKTKDIWQKISKVTKTIKQKVFQNIMMTKT